VMSFLSLFLLRKEHENENESEDETSNSNSDEPFFQAPEECPDTRLLFSLPFPPKSLSCLSLLFEVAGASL
jgi:hypothetical protein